METFLKSCGKEDLLPAITELGLTSVEDISLLEPSDLESDLDIDAETAALLVEKANEQETFMKRRAAVQSTWKAVEDSLSVDATKLFYKHLFETYPEVKPLFESADMDAQAEKLYKTVGIAVKYLDDVEGLLPILEEMGEKHAREWETKREHYTAVGDALVWTLKTGLGEAWTPEVADAWTWVYGVIAKTMADGGEKALEEEGKEEETNEVDEKELFEKRKVAVQSTWKTVEDSLSVDATKLFYQKLFENYPSVKPLFENADMDSQAEKLYKTVALAVKYLDDVEGLIPVLEEMGEKRKCFAGAAACFH